MDTHDLEVVPINPPSLVAALASGEGDAVEQFAMGEPLVVSAVGGDVQVLRYSEYLTDLYGVALATTTELASSNPDLCRRFRDALLRGLANALRDPQGATHILGSYVPEQVPEVAAQELEIMRSYSEPVAGPLGITRWRGCRIIP